MQPGYVMICTITRRMKVADSDGLHLGLPGANLPSRQERHIHGW